MATVAGEETIFGILLKGPTQQTGISSNRDPIHSIYSAASDIQNIPIFPSSRDLFEAVLEPYELLVIKLLGSFTLASFVFRYLSLCVNIAVISCPSTYFSCFCT